MKRIDLTKAFGSVADSEAKLQSALTDLREIQDNVGKANVNSSTSLENLRKSLEKALPAAKNAEALHKQMDKSVFELRQGLHLALNRGQALDISDIKGSVGAAALADVLKANTSLVNLELSKFDILEFLHRQDPLFKAIKSSPYLNKLKVEFSEEEKSIEDADFSVLFNCFQNSSLQGFELDGWTGGFADFEGLDEFSSFLGTNTRLSGLKLRSPIGGNFLEPLKALSSLTDLDLEDIEFDYSSIANLSQAILRNTALSSLRLITEDRPQEISFVPLINALRQNSVLQSSALREIEFSDLYMLELKALASIVQCSSSLRSLSFKIDADNQEEVLVTEGLDAFNDALKINKSIEYLEFSMYQVVDTRSFDGGFTTFLQENTSLTRLRSSANFTDEQIKSFGETLERNTTLNSLHLTSYKPGNLGTSAFIRVLKTNTVLD